MHPLTSNFKYPLYPIVGDPRFSGLFSPERDYDVRTKAGVTEQFIGEADSYHDRYTSIPDWTYHISRSLERIGVTGSPAVLDVGSGSGNSILPMLDLLPDSRIVATDISPDLLGILSLNLTPKQKERCLLVAMDACDDVLVPESFDLAIGAAILHHIVDPQTVIASTIRALKPGGYAVFYEPFESGSALIRLLYKNLFMRKFELGIRSKIAWFLMDLVRGFELRTGTDKSNEIYQQIDDKWVFTRTYFERVASELGCRVHSVYPLDEEKEQFSGKLRAHLRLGMGLGPEALPARAWRVVQEYDALLSSDLRQEIFVEGCLILAK